MLACTERLNIESLADVLYSLTAHIGPQSGCQKLCLCRICDFVFVLFCCGDGVVLSASVGQSE